MGCTANTCCARHAGWIAAGLPLLVLPVSAGALPLGSWSDGAQAALFAWLAAVLGMLAIVLGWRQAALVRQCEGLRHKLVAEHALRAGAERALLDSHEQLSRQAADEEAARSAERCRIGRDIHDDLGQHLLTLHLDIGALHANPRLPDWLAPQVAMIEQHMRLTLRSLRSVIDGLRPAALDHGLRHAVQRQLDEFARLSGIRCRLDVTAGDGVPGTGRPLPRFAAAEIAVFRILQEALSNVLRHAVASEVQVTLGRGPDGFILTVRDNGVGLPPARERRGRGLAGIGDRVAAAGGSLRLASLPGLGTSLCASVPVADADTVEADPAQVCG